MTTDRTIFWADGHVCLIDQRLIPHQYTINRYNDYSAVADAIRSMVVRGAPAIGATAAFGLALACQQSAALDYAALTADVERAASLLAASRPTAVNLFWALDRMKRHFAALVGQPLAQVRAAMLAEAQRIADEDAATNQRMGAHGAALIPQQATVIHHCNTGALAAVAWGTALGVIRSAHEQGKHLHVLVDETRPRLQGARLTSWELQRWGIDHTVIVDGASGHYMRTRQVDACFVGADRIAANGDTANKIGTYNLAIVAKAHGVPFYVVAPFSTVDLRLASGDLIPIEERDPDEVLCVGQERIAPDGVNAGNPAFDVTPHAYISGIVTEYGVIVPPFDVHLSALAGDIR
ncbi:MAG: S-methyl-5-thioribose-1-phosphate isomerase [bacterium]|nr:S-methyl-5-thioribose-1-phosphate isomerase [bacterium]